MDTPTTGYWTQFGTAASVDWCEPNYEVVAWIAEFWNTVSSVPIMLAGLVGLVLCWRSSWRIEPRYPLVFGGIAVVGFGSIAFHGTLLAGPQALDELPMVYAALTMTYCLRFSRAGEDAGPAMRRWRLGLGIFAGGFTLTYFTSETYFQIFVACFGAVIAWLCIQGGRMVYRPGGGPTLRRLYWTAAGSFVGAFAILWLPERLLGCDHPLQALQLHSFFHLVATVGIYTGGLVMLYDRLRHRGCDPRIGRELAVPFVRPPES